jgi:DNA-binding response OmpR family regulator
MCLFLIHEGFKPVVARDGREALELLRAGEVQPEVIVLDWMMPRMDGKHFMQERALDPAVQVIPVVVVTAAPLEGLAVDAAAILPKPCDFDALGSAIRRCAAPRR